MCTWHKDHSLYGIGILSSPKVPFPPQLVLYLYVVSRDFWFFENSNKRTVTICDDISLEVPQ